MALPSLSIWALTFVRVTDVEGEVQHGCGSRCGFKISETAPPHTVIPMKIGTQFTKRAGARSGAIPPFDLGPDLRQGDGR